MLHSDNEIRGRSLEALDRELKAEIKRFEERAETQIEAATNHKPNNALKSIATLIITQAIGK